jgi:LmbE family N-acetylglucosaminyl deacetylase
MGEVRLREMQAMARSLGLAGLTVLDLPDSRLAELDPREIESAVAGHIAELRPSVVVTYPVHGISGFPDHLATHAAVKRVFCRMRDEGADYLQRLAFFTVDEAAATANPGSIRLTWSRPEQIDCVVQVDKEDIEAFNRALDCYVTYQRVIRETKVRQNVVDRVCFEIFGETWDPPLEDLCRMA